MVLSDFNNVNFKSIRDIRLIFFLIFVSMESVTFF